MPSKKIINWAKVLEKWFTFTADEKFDYSEIAASYSRCAIGEQRARHPKVVVYTPEGYHRERVPQDSRLYDLGYEFYSNIIAARRASTVQEEASQIVRAVETLAHIKSRVRDLT